MNRLVSTDALATGDRSWKQRKPSDEPRGRGPAGATIAVVEDEVDIREALEELLSDAGYRVLAYASAARALREMQRGRHPDLVLLDLMMPDMNGWDFRVAQRRDPDLASIPVVAVSADVSSYAASIDADAHLTKPVAPDRLCLVIEQVLLATERRDLAAKAMEFERIRALGMLVASVAHEINNPLTYVLGNLELAAMRARAVSTPADAPPSSPDATKLAGTIDRARDGAERIEGVVRLLSTFAGGQGDGLELVDPSRAVDAACRLAAQQIRPRAQLEVALPELPLVHANEPKLAQVFLNLLVNAAHAIEPDAPEHNLVRVYGHVEDGRVTVEIQDTGAGIPAELQARIFEPFFTTKPVGKGTGLGLGISRDILREFGGRISVCSREGHGATFRVELPIPGKRDVLADEFDTASSTHSPRARPPSSTRKRILIVDDEEMIVEVIKASLDEHDVTGFVDPSEALQRLADSQYDLVLCDYAMPQMTGIDFYRALCERYPDLAVRFVLMSGASCNEELSDFAASHAVRLLQKPFGMQSIADCLHELEERSVA